MPTSFSLHLTLVGDQVSPVSYTLSPDRSEVILGSSQERLATFLISPLPPFLQEKQGLYLGHIYTPQLYINRRPYYLEVTPRPNHYRLREDDDSDRLFGFSILQPRLSWGERASIEQIHFENFDPGTAEAYFLSTRPHSSGPAVYSPAECSGPDDYCGPSGPESGFGLRGDEVVYTYKVSPDRKTVTVAASPKSLITDDLETNDTVRERYFFADTSSDRFQVGVDHPVYIRLGQEKRYLSNPRRLSENGPTIYQLTDQPRSDTACLSPMSPANWREMTLTPNDFVNLAFNNTPRLALWQDESFDGRPAVTSTPSGPDRSPAAPSQNPAPTFLAAYPDSVSPPPPAPLQVTTPAPAPRPFWKQWWFWLLLGLVLVLLIILIVLIIVRSRRSPPTIPVTVGTRQPTV